MFPENNKELLLFAVVLLVSGLFMGIIMGQSIAEVSYENQSSEENAIQRNPEQININEVNIEMYCEFLENKESVEKIIIIKQNKEWKQ